MMTVNEVSKMTGVSVRTLQYYDKIGLLMPAAYTESGYRMYNEATLERLQHILLFKELQFSLKEIKKILNSSDFERNRALEQQIELLTMRKEHLENLILFDRGIYGLGVRYMDFSVFDTKKMDEYAKQAKEVWGKTEAYKEFEEKQKNYSEKDNQKINVELMNLFVEFGKMKEVDARNDEVQKQVKKLQDFITEHFYNCTDKILAGLGKMYSGGGSITENINDAVGEGCAEFVAKAIEIYCSR